MLVPTKRFTAGPPGATPGLFRYLNLLGFKP